MSKPVPWYRKICSPAGLTASGMVLLGFILMDVHPGFLALAALGTFGPGVLREFGWLRDQDECRRRAAHRAGYHAYLVGGLLSFLLVARLRAGGQSAVEPEQLATLVLVILWFTWLLSSLLTYWGPQKTVTRILIIFGSVWLLFVVLSNHDNLPSMLMHALLVIPFYLLAWIARRRPRITGVALLLVSAFFFYFFGLYEIFGDRPLEKGRAEVLILFLGPLLASGFALLGTGALLDRYSEDEP